VHFVAAVLTGAGGVTAPHGPETLWLEDEVAAAGLDVFWVEQASELRVGAEVDVEIAVENGADGGDDTRNRDAWLDNFETLRVPDSFLEVASRIVGAAVGGKFPRESGFGVTNRGCGAMASGTASEQGREEEKREDVREAHGVERAGKW
jgi:hypothetical protein